MKRTGFTLAETLMAMVILVLAFLIVYALLHTSLRWGLQVERQAFAAVIAAKKMQEIRTWAWTKVGTQYNFASRWSPYAGVTVSDSDCPEYTIRTDVDGPTLYSPCTALEDLYAAFPASAPRDQRRKMTASMKKVRVAVYWDAPPLDPSKSVAVVSYVREPPLQFNAATPIVVTPKHAIPKPLPADAQITLTVAAFDSDGNRFQDLMFEWYVQPVTDPVSGIAGNGTIVWQARDGSSATFANQYLSADGVTWIHTGGECVVKARAVYRGVEQWGASPVLDLGT